MAEDYVLQTKVTADSTQFDATLKKTGKNLTAFSSEITKVTKLVGGLFAITSLTALAKSISDVSQEFSKATSNIAKGTGATGKALDNLAKSVNKAMLNGVGRSASEVGSMVADLNTRFDVTGEKLERMVASFDDFADVTDTDVKTSINTVADIMAKWNISLDDSDKLLDQLTVASQMSGASVTELSTSLAKGQSILSQFGMSLTESTALFASLKKNGVDTSVALAGMRTALANFSKDGKNAKNAFEEVSEKIKNAKNQTEALQIATETFGIRSGAEMLKVLQSSAEGAGNFAEALRKAGGALEETNQASRTSKDALDDLKATIQATFFSGGGDTKLRDMIDGIAEAIRNFDFSAIKETFSNIGLFIKGAWGQIKQLFNNLSGSIDIATGNFEVFADMIYQYLDNSYRSIQNFVNMIDAIMKGDWSVAWEYAKLIGLRAIKNLEDSINNAIKLMPNLFNSVIEGYNWVLEQQDKLFLEIFHLPEKYFKSAKLPKFEGNDLIDTKSIEKNIEDVRKTIEEKTGKSADYSLKQLAKVEKQTKKTTKSIEADIGDLGLSIISQTDKMDSAFDGFLKAWSKQYEDLAGNWNKTFTDMANIGTQTMGAMFDQIGQDLVNGGSGFESYASMAVDAISQVLKALASQITALAVVAIGEKNYAKAAYLMAGATTALVASGAMKAVSNNMKGTSSALENATNNLEDFTEKLKSLWGDSSTTRAVLSSMVATDSAIKFIADDTSKLNVAMSKQEVGVKNLIYSLQNQSEETQSLYEEYKLLYESLNKYNDEVKRSGNIVINYAKVVRKELISNSKALLNEVYSDFGNYGAKIGETLMDSLLSSATKSDYLKTMKDYIKKQMLQLAVYTESFTDEIADIGLKLINSITNDGSGIDIVTKRLSDLFEKSSAVAEKIDETINKSFAKIDSLATEAVSRLNELKSSLSELRNETTQGLNSFVISYNKLNKETYTYMKQSENVYTQNIKNLDDALSEYNSALSDLEEKTKALAKAGQQKVDYSVMKSLGAVNNPNFNSPITKSIGEAFDYYKEQSEKYYELLDTEKETIEQLLSGTAKDNLPNALIAFYYTYLKEFTDVYENYISAEEQLDSSRKDVNASLNAYKNANEELTKSVIEYQKALESYKTIYKNTIEETTANVKEQNATLDNQIGIYRTLYTLGKDFEKTLVSQNVFQTLKQQLLSVLESLQNSGATIGETLVSSILEGAKTTDFLSDMKSYIRENVVKLAVYSESLQSAIAGIGTNMIQAITTGDRSKLQSLKKDLEGVYKMATNNAKELLSVIDEIFDTVEDTTEAISNSQTTFVKAMNSFKETVSDLGGDLASQIINGLTNGLSQGDFLKNMKDWIRKMLIQSVVYTESMKSELEAIGQTISKAITGGFTEDTMHEIRRDLSWVFEQANKAVSSIDSVLGNVFSGYAGGTENATRGLHIVGESGPELVAFKGGERVYNNAESMRMLNGASRGGNNFNVTFNNLQDTSAFAMMNQLKNYNREMAINGVL